MDYKEILRTKVGKLREILAKYEKEIDENTIKSMQALINDTLEITTGRLDSLDYDVRDNTIMNYHSKLDLAISSLTLRFEKQGKDSEINK